MATLVTRIGPADHGRIMTLDEFLDAEEEPGYRYELARGVLEVTKIPDDSHEQTVWNVYNAIIKYQEGHPERVRRCGGRSEFRLCLPGLGSGRNPDIAIVLQNSPQNSRGRYVPELVVEVVSRESDQRDHQAKREEYLAFGLFEYWIIDPEKRQVTVLMRDGTDWVERVFTGDQPIVSLVLPGFATRVVELWINI